MCVHVYMCVHMYVDTCVDEPVCVYTHMWKPKVMSGVFHIHSSHYLLRQGLSLNVELANSF